MSFSLYLDEDSMNRALVAALRRTEVDCLTTSEARRRRDPDERQLEFSTANARVILTANQRDYVRLHRDWQCAGRSHGGIIVLTRQRTPVGLLINKLRLLQVRSAAEMRDTILFLNARPIEEPSR